ncbi:MAG: metallopeptidase family protein [Armatimonadota bacterium]
MRVTREAFEKLVAEAVESLPPEFKEKLENVEVLVRDEPPADWRFADGSSPLGVYLGLPLTHRSAQDGFWPDRIWIYQHPIEGISANPSQMVENVRITVLHEIAHHFGISDARLRELGY